MRARASSVGPAGEWQPAPEPTVGATTANLQKPKSKRTLRASIESSARATQPEPSHNETGARQRPKATKAGQSDTKSARAPSKAPTRRVTVLPGADLSESDSIRMRAKAGRIMAALESVYPEAPSCFLDHCDPFTLLVSVVLSAQTTDIKVNQVTPSLFAAAGDPEGMVRLGQHNVLEMIRTVGLAPQKSKALVGLSEMILSRFGGNVPSTFEELELLPGVGHKTASVVMMQGFGKPAFPVDTHIHRLACRWGCGVGKSVEKTEAMLKLWFPDESTWGPLHHRIILFGREYCPALKHDMESCPVCSFAATEEALHLNKKSQGKFVAAPRHNDPYSIRDASGFKVTTAHLKIEKVVKFEPVTADEVIGHTDALDAKAVSTVKRKRKRTENTAPDEVVEDAHMEQVAVSPGLEDVPVRSRLTRSSKQQIVKDEVAVADIKITSIVKKETNNIVENRDTNKSLLRAPDVSVTTESGRTARSEALSDRTTSVAPLRRSSRVTRRRRVEN